jgi:hypothetical protein
MHTPLQHQFVTPALEQLTPGSRQHFPSPPQGRPLQSAGEEHDAAHRYASPSNWQERLQQFTSNPV